MLSFILTNPLFIIAVAILSISWYMGFLRRVKPIHKHFGPISMIYLDYQGKYHNIGSQFKKISLNTQDYQPFHNAQPIAIYYDDPKNINDASKARAVVGIQKDSIIFQKGFKVVPEMIEDPQVKNFIYRYPEYRFAHMSEVDCLEVEFPYRFSLSCMIAMKKCLTPMMRMLDSVDREKENEKIMVVEQCNVQKQIILLDVPFGKGTDKMMLSRFEQPELKQKFK